MRAVEYAWTRGVICCVEPPRLGVKTPVKVMVWQWGRIGAGPRFAVLLADALRGQDGVESMLSLSSYADVLAGSDPPDCALPVTTYRGHAGFVVRVLAAPWLIVRLATRLRALRPDLAVCAMPGPMDMIMVRALRCVGVPSLVIVHDADAHPGDGLPFLMGLQRWLCRSADAVGALTGHVWDRLAAQGLSGRAGRPLVRLFHPPMPFQRVDGDWTPRRPDEPLRLLFFGRLLPYKGIDLLLDTLDTLGPRADMTVRVVGSGPETLELQRLRDHPGVTVDNRWVPEVELGGILGWADALVLPYREASQSGVAAAGLAAGCAIVATDVGGLREQLADQPNVTLCPPDARAIAAALDHLARHRPVRASQGVDAEAAWRDMAASLLRQAHEIGLIADASAGSRPSPRS